MKLLAIREEGPEAGDVRPLRPRIEPVLESVAIARLFARAGGAAMHTATGFAAHGGRAARRARAGLGTAAVRGEEVLGIWISLFMRCSVNPGFVRCLGRGVIHGIRGILDVLKVT